MVKAIERYECGRCGETHDTEEDAVDCCAPSVSHVWECGECGETFDDEDEADECCLEDGAEKPDPTTQQFPDPAYAFNTEAYVNEFLRLNNLVGAPKKEQEAA